MKAFISVFFLSLFTFTASNAQVRVAITGGVHGATVNEKNDVPGFDEYQQDYKTRTAGHFGFIADIPFSPNSPLSFQPGVIYYGKGRKYFSLKDTATSSISSITASQFINYIDIPLNLVFRLRLGKTARFIIGGGPYAGLFYNGKEESATLYKNGAYSSDLNEDLPVGNAKGKYAVFNYGVNGQAGFEFGRIILTMNAGLGLNDFYQSATYEGSFRHQVTGASLGIYLGKNSITAPKIKDTDKDGVPDDQDKCPQIPGSAATGGCPDTDADGIPDIDDKCPTEAGLLKYNGCGIPDTDHDGINDEEDQCPTIPGKAAYHGCPVPDTDHDGINDEEDKCPDVAGVTRYQGCPVPDTDQDGINDELDKCPTVAGTAENNGCPAITKDMADKVDLAAKRIQFDQYKTTLTPASQNQLQEVAAILLEHPELKLVIEGHTSADGNEKANLLLSQQRADAVKTYLVSRGVAAERLMAIGYGMSKPLNNSKTPSEKAKNRRVELKLSN